MFDVTNIEGSMEAIRLTKKAHCRDEDEASTPLKPYFCEAVHDEALRGLSSCAMFCEKEEDNKGEIIGKKE